MGVFPVVACTGDTLAQVEDPLTMSATDRYIDTITSAHRLIVPGQGRAGEGRSTFVFVDVTIYLSLSTYSAAYLS